MKKFLIRLAFRLGLYRGLPLLLKGYDGHFDYRLQITEPVFFGMLSRFAEIKPEFLAFCDRYDLCFKLTNKSSNPIISFPEESDRALYGEMISNIEKHFAVDDVNKLYIWARENSAIVLQNRIDRKLFSLLETDKLVALHLFGRVEPGDFNPKIYLDDSEANL